MKRFHVYMNVVDLDGSIRGATPARPPAARADRVTAMKRVLFGCVENANRSQIAEAFARLRGGGAVAACSACAMTSPRG